LALSLLSAGFVYAANVLPRQGTDSPCSTAVPACVSWEIAFTSCQDLACECSAAVSLGTQCGDACYITANPSAYSFLSTLASACIASETGGVPSVITPAPASVNLVGADECNTGNPACTAFSASVASCALTDEACQCPIILEYGPACSICYASYEPDIASAYSGLISACGGINTGGGSVATPTGNAATTGGNTQQATAATGGANAKSTTGSPNTTKSTSGASRYDGLFGVSAVLGISVVVFIGSVVTLFFG